MAANTAAVEENRSAPQARSWVTPAADTNAPGSLRLTTDGAEKPSEVSPGPGRVRWIWHARSPITDEP